MNPPGVLALDGGTGLGGRAVTRHDPALSAKAEEIEISDARLMPIWGAKLYRILPAAEGAARSGRWALETSET